MYKKIQAPQFHLHEYFENAKNNIVLILEILKRVTFSFVACVLECCMRTIKVLHLQALTVGYIFP